MSVDLTDETLACNYTLIAIHCVRLTDDTERLYQLLEASINF